MDPRIRSSLDRLPCCVDVLDIAAGQTRNGTVLDVLRDGLYRLKIPRRYDGKSRLDNVDLEFLETVRNLYLFLKVHAAAR